MELVKIGKDKYLIKGSRGVIINEEERVKLGITIDGKGCENCSKKHEVKQTKKKKKEIKPVAEVIEETDESKEVDIDDTIEETTETI